MSADNGYSSYGYVGKNAVNSAGELSRLRSRLGVRVSGANRPSEFIIVNKLKKAIQQAIHKADERMRVTFDRLKTKLDRLTIDELEFLQSILGEDGFDQMITTIQQKATVIHRQAMKWKNSLLAIENSDDDLDLIPEGVEPIL